MLGSPGARKMLAGKYGELTPLRQRGGTGGSSSLPTYIVLIVRDLQEYELSLKQ